jgi:hypothetical protein
VKIYPQPAQLVVKPCSVYGQHQQSSLMVQAFTQQEDRMVAKKVGRNKWLTFGRNSGFGLGFNVCKYYVSLELGFWYLAFEF